MASATLPENKRLLSATDAAAFLGMAAQTLALWRCTGRYSLPYVRVGRTIKYRVCDLETWLADRTATCTGTRIA